jgi:hypothetical protein
LNNGGGGGENADLLVHDLSSSQIIDVGQQNQQIKPKVVVLKASSLNN